MHLPFTHAATCGLHSICAGAGHEAQLDLALLFRLFVQLLMLWVGSATLQPDAQRLSSLTSEHSALFLQLPEPYFASSCWRRLS